MILRVCEPDQLLLLIVLVLWLRHERDLEEILTRSSEQPDPPVPDKRWPFVSSFPLSMKNDITLTLGM